MAMKNLTFGLCLAGVALSPALAQTLPPTTQQLQAQHDQAIRNEANTARSNLLQSQIQTPPPPQPYLTPSGRAVAHPPGYIAPPGR
jgi:hypothetical protein